MASSINPVELRYYPETAFGAFSRDSGTLQFYARINALLTPGMRLLDLGAGRGAVIVEERDPFLRSLKTMKGKVAHVAGCDVDDAVFENPHLDSATLIEPGKPLPYADGEFDLVYASWVLEHLEDPAFVLSEVRRVLKPGGYFCAVTPNRRGYLALAARVLGNRRHVQVLSRVQPGRKSFDVFPTHYRVNTKGAVRRFLGAHGDLAVYAMSNDPSYYFGKGWLFAAFRALHKLTPEALHTALFIFFRKASPEADARHENARLR